MLTVPTAHHAHPDGTLFHTHHAHTHHAHTHDSHASYHEHDSPPLHSAHASLGEPRHRHRFFAQETAGPQRLRHIERRGNSLDSLAQRANSLPLQPARLKHPRPLPFPSSDEGSRFAFTHEHAEDDHHQWDVLKASRSYTDSRIATHRHVRAKTAHQPYHEHHQHPPALDQHAQHQPRSEYATVGPPGGSSGMTRASQASGPEADVNAMGTSGDRITMTASNDPGSVLQADHHRSSRGAEVGPVLGWQDGQPLPRQPVRPARLADQRGEKTAAETQVRNSPTSRSRKRADRYSSGESVPHVHFVFLGIEFTLTLGSSSRSAHPHWHATPSPGFDRLAETAPVSLDDLSLAVWRSESTRSELGSWSLEWDPVRRVRVTQLPRWTSLLDHERSLAQRLDDAPPTPPPRFGMPC